jgi:transcriptional regulator with XRE-family HTH domain
MTTGTFTSSQPVGTLVREWRARRRLSQMELALAVGVSPRHMSFVETGRSKPSPATLLAMAEELAVPLRDRNRMLLAAGYAPRFEETPMDDTQMATVQQALQRLLNAHHPYPGVVLDRHWNVVLANDAAAALVSLLPADICTPAINIFRVGLHPRGLAAITENFEEWGRYLLRQLARLRDRTADDSWAALEREVCGYENVQRLLASSSEDSASQSLLVPCVLMLPSGRVSMFTTLTTFGTPQDVTLEELCIELFYPTDERSELVLRGGDG